MSEERKIWVLTRTEYAGQCTGFNSETVLMGLFDKKPTLIALAPYLDPNLSGEMGAAIAEVQGLLDRGSVSLGGTYDTKDYDLRLVPMHKRLDVLK